MTVNRILTTTCLMLTSLMAAGAEPQNAPERIEFSSKAVLGDVTHHRIVTKAVGSMKMFESMPAQRFTQTYEQDLVIRCLQVNPDGSAVFELTMPRVAMKMNFGGIAIEFDSDRPDNAASAHAGLETLSKVFLAFTKIKCQLTVSPTGEPLKVEGLSEGVKQVIDEIAENLPIPGMKGFFDKFSEFMADDSILENMRSAHRMIPDAATAQVGDRWQREWDMPLPIFGLSLQGKGEYELAAVEEFRGRRCAKIRGKQNLSMRPGTKASGETASGFAGVLDRMQFSMETSGGEVTAYWDYKNGKLIDTRETQRMTIVISMDPDGQADDTGTREGSGARVDADAGANAQDGRLPKGFGKLVQKFTTSVHVELIEDTETGEKTGVSAEPASKAGAVSP